ncbi:MAG TPA: flagellin FliC [Planctomycetes bacterium]|nr:flagellin FliC [Planctomycetota bacterium]
MGPSHGAGKKGRPGSIRPNSKPTKQKLGSGASAGLLPLLASIERKPMRINANQAALAGQRILRANAEATQKNFKRLASGIRLTTASDDSAALAMSQRLGAEIRSQDQASRNSLDGVSALQTAEGALQQSSDILARMRELSIQSSNGTLNDQDRATINQEYSQLSQELDRIANSTQFNGKNLLDGSHSSLSIQAGSGTKAGIDQIEIKLNKVDAGSLGISGTSLGPGGDPKAAIDALDKAIDKVSNIRGSIGSSIKQLGRNVSTLGSSVESLKAANSRIQDADFATEVAERTRLAIQKKAGIAVFKRSNEMKSAALNLL